MKGSSAGNTKMYEFYNQKMKRNPVFILFLVALSINWDDWFRHKAHLGETVDSMVFWHFHEDLPIKGGRKPMSITLAGKKVTF